MYRCQMVKYGRPVSVSARNDLPKVRSYGLIIYDLFGRALLRLRLLRRSPAKRFSGEGPEPFLRRNKLWLLQNGSSSSKGAPQEALCQTPPYFFPCNFTRNNK